jgi:MFS family permease
VATADSGSVAFDGRSATLWRHADFRRLWLGQTISAFGSQVTLLALPLTAATVLDAGPGQMGLLGAAGALPALTLGLLIGVWVDRRRRLPVLIGADLARAALLLTIPLAALFDVLSFALLLVVAMLVGGCTLVFDIAYRAYLPALVARERLVDGNSKLELSRSSAEVGGPALAGGLLQFMRAPLAVAFDAASFLGSALALWRIRSAEPLPAPTGGSARREIGEGLRLVTAQPLLRAVMSATATVVFFSTALEAVFLLYLVRELDLPAGLLGLIFAGGSVGFVLGALLPERVGRRFGLGVSLLISLALMGLSDLTLPLLRGPHALVVPLLVGAQFVFGVGLTLYNVNQLSLRQRIVPDHLLGRVNATEQVLVRGLAPLGALLGGALGIAFGLRTTLVIAALGELLAVGWIVRVMRDA